MEIKLVSKRASLFESKVFFSTLVNFLLLIAPSSWAASAFDYINTPAFRSGGNSYYHSHILSDTQRANIISAAKAECGGRYEGVEAKMTELSHEIGTSKTVIPGGAPGTYQLVVHGTSETTWLVIETIKCSIHSGHMKSVLHSRLVNGKEKLDITYKYVADVQVGTETVSNIVRTYGLGAKQMTGQYKTPYGTVVP